MKERILKNKKTTALAIVILLLLSGLLVWKGKATFEEIGSFLGAVGTFIAAIIALFSKDPKKWTKREEKYREEAKTMDSDELARRTGELLDGK